MTPRMIDIISADTAAFFNLDEAGLFNLKLDYGITYLEKRFEHDPKIADALKRNAKYWLWWRELWAERDRKLLGMCSKKEFFIAYLYPVGEPKHFTYIPMADTWDFYSKYHRPERISFYPNYVLINECMASQQPEIIQQ